MSYIYAAFAARCSRMRPDNRNFDLIIIGSGIGGLTVASLMAQLKHQRVLVLERHFRLGGFPHSFTRPGHRAWDVGLHYVGGMAAGDRGRQLFDLVTRFGVRWQKMPSPFEKFVYPDFSRSIGLNWPCPARASEVTESPQSRTPLLSEKLTTVLLSSVG